MPYHFIYTHITLFSFHFSYHIYHLICPVSHHILILKFTYTHISPYLLNTLSLHYNSLPMSISTVFIFRNPFINPFIIVSSSDFPLTLHIHLRIHILIPLPSLYVSHLECFVKYYYSFSIGWLQHNHQILHRAVFVKPFSWWSIRNSNELLFRISKWFVLSVYLCIILFCKQKWFGLRSGCN